MGNPISYRGMTMEWEQGRKLKKITGNGVTQSHSYDADGIRIRNNSTQTEHLFLHRRAAMEHDWISYMMIRANFLLWSMKESDTSKRKNKSEKEWLVYRSFFYVQK